MTPLGSVIRVLVLEDDKGTRQALAVLLDGSPGFACAGAVATAESALRHLATAPPDLVLVDLELPGLGGADFCAASRRRFPQVELLVLTMHDEAEWVFPALEAGASGYVLKGTPPAKVLEAVAEVHAGGSFMSGPVARLVMQRFRRPAPAGSAVETLSPREREVLELLAQGLRYAEIAARLHLSVRTINSHLRRIYDKLHVHSAAGAVGKISQ